MSKTPWRLEYGTQDDDPVDIVDADGEVVRFFDELSLIVSAVNFYSSLPDDVKRLTQWADNQVGWHTMDLSDQLRQAIKSSGIPLRELQQRSGVPYPNISRFTTGARPSITIQTAGKLASALGLHLAPKGDSQ